MLQPPMQVVLVALPGVDVGAIEREVQRQCDALPRSEVARQALAHSCIIMAAGKVCVAHHASSQAHTSSQGCPQHLTWHSGSAAADKPQPP